METNVYRIDGSSEKKLTLPNVFAGAYNQDLIKRAILAEQSRRYQPQGHYVLAGMNTSAAYIGRYSTYRTYRHVGKPARPRQMLAKGAMGDVRRIPSAVKGKRAHPHMVEKKIMEKINRKEYAKALESAVASTGNSALIKKNHVYGKDSFPIIVVSEIEKIRKTKELMKLLKIMGADMDIEKSHKPRTKEGNRRRSKKRYFRRSILIVAKNTEDIEKAGRNIPGVDILAVDRMKVEVLAPDAKPRLTLWSEAAISSLPDAIANSVANHKQ
jgi:large subunit ribosomal protein L4e